jgi:hypothetical protein
VKSGPAGDGTSIRVAAEYSRIPDAMEAYLARPWAVREALLREQQPDGAAWWWQSLLVEGNTESIREYMRLQSPVERLLRRTLVSFNATTDQWVLRIICASHAPLAIHLWPLVLARAKGICLKAQAPNEPPQRPTTPTRNSTPNRGSTPSPEPQTPNQGIIYKAFERDDMASKNPRLFFEMEDSDPITDEGLVQLSQILDLVEVMRFPLLAGPYERLYQTMEFLFDVITRPEGKLQRQKTANLVMRACGVIAFFLSEDAARTKRALAECFQGSMERAMGAISRVNYYNPGASLVMWLKKALQSEETPPPEQDQGRKHDLRRTMSAIESEQIRIPGREYEQVYRSICLHPHLAHNLRADVFARLDAGETEPMFVSIALSVAYENAEDFAIFADSLSKWKAKMFVRNNERLDAFLQACTLLETSKHGDA